MIFPTILVDPRLLSGVDTTTGILGVRNIILDDEDFDVTTLGELGTHGLFGYNIRCIYQKHVTANWAWESAHTFYRYNIHGDDWEFEQEFEGSLDLVITNQRVFSDQPGFKLGLDPPTFLTASIAALCFFSFLLSNKLWRKVHGCLYLPTHQCVSETADISSRHQHIFTLRHEPPA